MLRGVGFVVFRFIFVLVEVVAAVDYRRVIFFNLVFGVRGEFLTVEVRKAALFIGVQDHMPVIVVVLVLVIVEYASIFFTNLLPFLH